jgi:hypothetical protein
MRKLEDVVHGWRGCVETNLVLDEELDTLDGGGSGLRDRGGHTTHHEVDEEVLKDNCQ